MSKKLENLEKVNTELTQELAMIRDEMQQKNEKIRLLQNELESLKITNSLLGSEEYKKETKLKINALIREIDYCIAQLSD
ncbi:hypothetical protein [Flavobacterium sp.]|nr:hypothetical protein [Flavobacterium sp.]